MNSLNAWRGIGALLVVAFHIRLIFDGAIPIAEYTLFLEKGYLWVEMFFLLSGYTLSRIYYEQLRAIELRAVGRFIVLRLARLYPLHVLMLVCMVIGVLLTGGDFVKKLSLSSLLSNLLLIHSWAIHDRLTWNLPSWAISVLFAAYIVFPFLMVALRQWPALLRTVLVLGAIASLIVLEQTRGTLDLHHDVGLIRCLAEFSLGILLHQITALQSLSRVKCVGVLQWMCIAALVLAMHFGVYDVAIVGLMALLILLFSEDRGFLANVFQARSLQVLGALSFTIYLIHYPVGRIYRAHPPMLKRLFPDDPVLASIAHFCEVMIVFVLLAWVLNRWFETPMRNVIRKLVTNQNQK